MALPGFSKAHGWVATATFKGEVRYFTGVGFSPHINCAKVFSTSRGAWSALKWYRSYAEDMGEPIPDKVWATKKALSVSLTINQAEGVEITWLP